MLVKSGQHREDSIRVLSADQRPGILIQRNPELVAVAQCLYPVAAVEELRRSLDSTACTSGDSGVRDRDPKWPLCHSCHS